VYFFFLRPLFLFVCLSSFHCFFLFCLLLPFFVLFCF
jgi:hypothetical protein